MELQLKIESGFVSNDHKNMENMSIKELVSVLRTAYLIEDFDKVEDVLVSRDKRIQIENQYFKEKIEMERILIRFKAEEDLRKIEKLCEREKIAQSNYEKLLKEVCELRNLKEKWVDDSNVLAELRIKIGVLENEKNELELKISEFEKSMKKNSDFEYKDEENDNEIVNLTPLQRYEPLSKRSKNAQGASIVTTQTRGAMVDAAHSGHGHLISSLCMECAPIVEEQQTNDNVFMSEEFIVTDSVVVPPSDEQEQMETQNKGKRKRVATNASASSFDNLLFLSSVHQEHYSKFLANKKFVGEKNFQLEGDKFLDIQAMIVARGWVELTSFAKEASKTLAKEFFANAYQGPSEEDGNDKKTRMMRVISFVRGKKVPFHGKIINQLLGLENFEQCSFKARVAEGSNIDHQEILSTLCKPEADWVRNKDGRPIKLRSCDLTLVAKAWATFVLHTLLPCSNVSDLTIRKAILLTAILKGEPVNVGRLLAHNLWVTANCCSPTSCINHASLINKLCERVKVYPENNEEMMKTAEPITTKWIEKNSIVTSNDLYYC